MTRAQQTISIALLLSSVRDLRPYSRRTPNRSQLYLAIFTEIVSLPEKIQKEVVPVVCSLHPLLPRHSLTQLQLPFWALVSFGSYLLFKLGWGVFTFNDVPEAHKELLGQIKQARAELRSKGVDVGED
jgi:dolichyl-phosphate mannosyltransferase polypeptide 3